MSEGSKAAWRPTRQLERGNAADRILADLRTQIVSGQLPRGTKLPTEKALAAGYSVSGATVREAVRGLATAGLIEVRHGSGAYVTADADQLIAVSLQSMLQMERIGVSQVLGVLGALNAYAAELAVANATAEDLQRLQVTLDAIESAETPDAVSTALSQFLDALARASGNPLLAALCRFLAGIQIGLARELMSGSPQDWRKTSRRLAKERKQLVDSIKARDPEAARDAARIYQRQSIKTIAALPNAGTALVSEHTLARLFSPSPD